MAEMNVAQALGADTVHRVLETVDNRALVDLARKLLKGEVMAQNVRGIDLGLKDETQQEIAPFAAVAIGFAAGAAARLAGKKKEMMTEAATNEAFPLVVAAFIAGAVTGAKAVDGKL